MDTYEKQQISLRIPSSMLADFERIATGLDRDRTWVMLRAFRSFLDGEGAQLLSEIEGIEDLDAGRIVDFDEMIEKAEAIIADQRKKRLQKAV